MGGDVYIVGCQEQFTTLTEGERLRAQKAFDKAIAEEDLHLLAAPYEGPFRSTITARVNKAIGRVVVVDWLLLMSRGEPA